ncbi:MAG: HAMP domain-containing histidine kinase [Phycisphaerales bacterium]|nr:HAMP domain-containing histidine kinase [Phycisphaerales bacterium]
MPAKHDKLVMTLARRIVVKTVVLTAALLAAGAGMLTGMLTLQKMSASTREEFDELRGVRSVDRNLQTAIRQVTSGEVDGARESLAEALTGLAAFDDYQQEKPSAFSEEHAETEVHFGSEALAAIRAAMACVETAAKDDSCLATAEAELHRATATLDRLADEIEDAVAAVHERTAKRFRATTWLLLSLALVSVGAGLIISISHYRSVVKPLRELRAGTDRLAMRELGVRLEPGGDHEFTDLKRSFNHMAEELESLCHNLEDRVTQQSKELAVAERLASVGFLAAGVAHEVNNPLAIIAGYAESMLRRMGDGAYDQSGNGAWKHDLEAIRDEAFRCKRITQNLLDLSRMGDAHREAVSLRGVAEACIRLIGAWPGCGNTRIEFRPSNGDPCVVHASEQELRQVVLNLLTNAVEAAAVDGGRVDVSLHRDNGWVELRVRDNGCGMSAETLDHVFEPFFTTGKGRRGLGLGLSISHAIAQRQDGMLTARSDGAGCGSEFVLRLPAHGEVTA